MIIYYFAYSEYSDNVTLTTNKMGIFCLNLNDTKLDDTNFYKDYPKTIIHVKILAWPNKPKKRKAF